MAWSASVFSPSESTVQMPRESSALTGRFVLLVLIVPACCSSSSNIFAVIEQADFGETCRGPDVEHAQEWRRSRTHGGLNGGGGSCEEYDGEDVWSLPLYLCVLVEVSWRSRTCVRCLGSATLVRHAFFWLRLGFTRQLVCQWGTSSSAVPVGTRSSAPHTTRKRCKRRGKVARVHDKGSGRSMPPSCACFGLFPQNTNFSNVCI